MMQKLSPPSFLRLLLGVCLISTSVILSSGDARAKATDRASIQAFLEVTGFDVALDSIALSAAAAPQMLGLPPDAFGSDWERLTARVFDTKTMRNLALDILENTLTDELLTHAADFYASDIGQRLVEVENTSHMIEDDDVKQQQGERLIADMVASGDERLEVLKRMNAAIGTSDNSLKAIQEIQIRFLLSASAAGVVDLRVDPDELRAAMKEQEGALRLALQQSALSGAAFTYRDISEPDLEAYAVALEHPLMGRVYELLNAVQFEVMANRFEELAQQMAELHPGQDI